MNIFKKGLIMLMIIGSLLSCFVGCDSSFSQTDNGKVNENVNAKYDTLKLKEIPVGMWVTLPAKYRDNAHFADMASCGINFINGFEYYETNLEEIKAALDLAQTNNIKYLVADKEISNLIENYKFNKNKKYIDQAMERIENYYDHPAYAGQLFKDEPSRTEFDVLKPFIDAYRENYPKKRWHINMFPVYATAGAGVPYEQYVDDWIEEVNPDYYSYDFYPLLEYDDKNYFARPEREDYFYNLDIVRAKTKAEGIPFWNFIQTLGFSNTTGEGHREPSNEDLRWQVFSSLAFGVKGIQYFCYSTPGNGAEQFSPALVDGDGQKTVRYDYVKQLNEDFREYGKILLNCDADGVIFNGVNKSEKKYKLFEEALTSYGNVKAVSGGKFLAGCFKHSGTGKKYMLVTTVNPREGAEVVLEFNNPVSSVDVWKNSKKEKVSTNANKLTLNIDKGEAVFIEI